MLTSAAQHEAANKIVPSNGGQLDRLLAIDKNCYAKGRDKFYESHEECIPLITLENVLAGIETLVRNCAGPFSVQEASKEYDWGYRFKEMNKSENINDPAALELYVSQWIDHVIFYLGKRGKLSVIQESAPAFWLSHYRTL